MNQPVEGQVFERLTCLAPAGRRGGHALWRCRCVCGHEITTRASSLFSGNSQSCGCLKRELTSLRSRTHGQSVRGQTTSEYWVWSAMIQRCENPRNKSYQNYGARGITVSSEWKRFEAFHADMGPRPYAAATIERINNEGPYCKDNCKWGTRTEQSRNRRGRRIVTFRGEELPLSAAAELAGIPYHVARKRINRGWSVEKALTLECKRPGEEPTAIQLAWHESHRALGVYVAVVTSVDEALAAVESARRGEA